MASDLDTRPALRGDYWRAVMIATVIAVAVVAALYVAGQAFGASMDVTTPIGSSQMTIGIWLAIGESVAASVIGGALAWLLGRFVPYSRGIFLGIAFVVFVLLSIGASTAGEDGGTIVVLLLMHVGVLAPTLALVVPRLPNSR